MRNFRTLSLLFVLGICVALAAAPASANIINMTTNTLLFYDNFESQPSANISHNAYGVDSALDATPVYPASSATTYWANTVGTDYRQIQVTDYTSGTIAPGAYEGNNYLRLGKESGDTSKVVRQYFDSSSLSAGDHFHWEQMVYIGIPYTNAFYAQIATTDGTTDTVDFIQAATIYSSSSDDFQIQNRVNGANNNTGLTVARNTWQKWEFDYVLGETTYDLTIGGVTVADLPVNRASHAAENLLRTQMYTASGNPAGAGYDYIDEVQVPEPSTLALLATSLLGLLAYAWRKRK